MGFNLAFKELRRIYFLYKLIKHRSLWVGEVITVSDAANTFLGIK